MNNLTKLILTIVGTVIIGCGNNDTSHIGEAENQHLEYEQMVDSLGIRTAYEDVKWIFYCMYCDSPAKSFVRIDSFTKYDATFGQLPLRIDFISFVRPDTIEISFAFYYQDTTKLDISYVLPFGVSGAAFTPNTDTMLYLSGYGGWISNVSCDDTIPKNKCPEREINPLQPEVAKYIKENRGTLDPWFREEAIRRGVIPK